MDETAPVHVDSLPVDPVAVLGLLPLHGILRLLQGILEEDFTLGQSCGGDPPGLGNLVLLLYVQPTRLRSRGIRGTKSFHGELVG